MQGARDELFARAAFAADEHRGLGLADALQEIVHFFHRRARAEQLVEAARFFDRALQALHLERERAVLDGALDGDRHHVDVERLGDEVVSSGADRLNCRFHAAERGDHDHRQLGMQLGCLLTQLEPIQLAHVDVREHHVEVLHRELVERFVRIGLPVWLVAVLLQAFGEQLAHAGVVVYDEYFGFHWGSGIGR